MAVQCKTKKTEWKKTVVVLPAGCPLRVGVIAGNGWTKRKKILLFLRDRVVGWGGGVLLKITAR